jgi:hypothetical protein
MMTLPIEFALPYVRNPFMLGVSLPVDLGAAQSLAVLAVDSPTSRVGVPDPMPAAIARSKQVPLRV